MRVEHSPYSDRNKLPEIFKNAAFESNGKREIRVKKVEYSPGPGNYSQYSSIYNPLIFPYGGTNGTYVVYENGRMMRKVQGYTADKRKSDRNITIPTLSPGPGSYNINISSFHYIKRRCKKQGRRYGSVSDKGNWSNLAIGKISPLSGRKNGHGTDNILRIDNICANMS
jgi:hypothetical protein